MPRVLFIALFLLILGAMSYYAYARFLGRIGFLSEYRLVLKIFCIALWLGCLCFVLFGLGAKGLPLWLYLLCASCIGASFFLFSLGLGYEIFSFLIKLASHKEKTKLILDIAFVILAIALLVGGVYAALKPPALKQVDVQIADLKNEIKIAMISDVHIGEFLQEGFLKKVVQKINSAQPDMVVIVGDLVDLPADKVANMLKPLKELRSKYGSFFVPGNHEYYHGASQIMQLIQSLGIKVLQNENQQVAGVNLIGLLDLAGLGSPLAPDPAAAFKTATPNTPSIVLAHQPKALFLLDKAGFKADLVLSGHTHAGQIFPFSLLVKLDQPYLYGLYKHNDKTQIYVSSGAGFWGPPLRIFAPSEIAILNLKEKK